MDDHVLSFPPPFQRIYTFVSDPVIPYTGRLPEIDYGLMITIGGRTNSYANRFEINLRVSNQQDGDIAFHLNPRFERTYQIIRNTLRDSKWEHEERETKTFPLAKGAYFECIILCQKSCYKVSFNGSHFCDYKHRMLLRSVCYLDISGDVTVQSVHYQAPPTDHHSTQMVMEITEQLVPYSTHISGGLYAGRIILISGKVDKIANRFCIELAVPSASHPIVAFHFNPRFNWLSKNYVVRNSYLNNAWGEEEIEQSYFPFGKGVGFDMIILCESDRIKVAINHSHFLDYTHRVWDLSSIQTLQITGDVRVINVKL